MSLQMVRQSSGRLSLEKKAWFLCKFLSSSLDDDNFEKLRYHVSICKGVKTKVKLSEKGWSTGFKSIRNFSHKLPYQYFPLEFIENIHQDVMFINVLLCVFRMQNLPGIQYEIVAYKFADNATVKKFQDIFQILTGAAPPQQTQTLRAPGSSLALVPARQYHVGTLSPDRWGSRDRLADNGSHSEISHNRFSFNRGGGAISYAMPRRRSAGGAAAADEHSDLGIEVDRSYTTDSDSTACRDVATMVQFEEGALGAESAEERGETVLHFQRYRPYLQEGVNVAEVGCQVRVPEGGRGGRETHGARMLLDSEGSWSGDSSLLEDTGPLLRTRDGTVVARPSAGGYRARNGIALTSIDTLDGPTSRRTLEHEQMTSSIRKVYNRAPSERGRTPDVTMTSLGLRNQGNNDGGSFYGRSRSVDPSNGGGSRPQGVTGGAYGTLNPSEIYRASDAVSVKSQSSYLLAPNFKKVYGKRSGGQQGGYAQGGYTQGEYAQGGYAQGGYAGSRAYDGRR